MLFREVAAFAYKFEITDDTDVEVRWRLLLHFEERLI
jgi:hypothetical protein